MGGWQDIQATNADVDSWLAKGFAGAGILAKHFPAVDLDIRDEAVVGKMIKYCEKHIGKTYTRVGAAPKAILPYRTNSPFTKLFSAIYEDPDTKLLHQVELLGEGEQWVAFAIHPDTKKPYTWLKGSVAEGKAEDLPLITRDQALAVLDYFEEIAPGHWKMIKERPQGSLSIPVSTEADKQTPTGTQSGVDIPLHIFEKYINKYLDPDILGYDDFAAVGMGLHHLTDGSEEALAIWMEWGKKSVKYVERKGDITMPSKWASFVSAAGTKPKTAVGILALIKKAGGYVTAMKEEAKGEKDESSIPQATGMYGKNHTLNAELFLATATPAGTLKRDQQTWYLYSGKSWEAKKDQFIKGWLTKEMALSKPQSSTINGTYQVIEGLVATDEGIGGMPAGLLIAQNGILHIKSQVLLPHDKKYFTTHILNYDHDFNAKPPNWEKFLAEIFEGDKERIALLQEWFGYLISGQTNCQKIMLLKGSPRGGKGIIGHIIGALIGEKGFAGGTLEGFATGSYMETLATKSAVFIGDAEKTVPKNICSLVTSRMKSISGEDEITFKRKYKSDMNCHIPARITIASNSLPRLFDDSGAWASRLLIIPFRKSFLGKEDFGLRDRLVLEVAGIANWALKGLERLANNKNIFTYSEASRMEVLEVQEISSPISVFINSGVCEFTPGTFTSSRRLYAAYCDHAKALTPGDLALSHYRFSSAFKDAVQGKPCRYKVGSKAGASARGFEGLAINQEKLSLIEASEDKAAENGMSNSAKPNHLRSV